MATSRHAAQLENDMHPSAHNASLGAEAPENGHWPFGALCSVFRS